LEDLDAFLSLKCKTNKRKKLKQQQQNKQTNKKTNPQTKPKQNRTQVEL